jgi:phi LC3 family holin
MLRLFEVYPSITENQIVNIVNQALTFLGLIGVLQDPTTSGLSDSNRAMTYTEPYKDYPEDEE